MEEDNHLVGLDIIDNEPDYSKSIEENNKVLIYLAGDGRRYFSANFTIFNPVKILNKDDGIYKYFDFLCRNKKYKEI